MEKHKKYRVHVINHDSYSSKGADIRYVIQKRGILAIWYTISDEMDNEAYANNMCEQYNKYNTHQ